MEGRVNLITSHLGVSVDRRKKEATRKRCLADEVLFRVPGLLQDQSFHGVVSTCFKISVPRLIARRKPYGKLFQHLAGHRDQGKKQRQMIG